TINLEKVSKIRGVKTDLFGNTSWGIPDPENATVKVFISKNGTDFAEVGTLNKGKQAAADPFVRNIFSLDFDDELSARYVRFQFSISGNYVWASELHFYGLSE
ncbi:MAG: hypothetical protein IJC85_06445, partial [Oscillospiraceae bacterium]|nr:hypothetical protein [Oscillospiraceae bacterium]